MNFRDTFFTFTLNYCKRNCLVPGLSNAALMVHAPTKDFHDLPIPDEPLTTTPAITLETKYSRSVYRKCTAEDENEQAPPNQGTEDLYIPITLSPGTNFFRIRQIDGNPDSRAMMIATSPANRPVPTSILAGQRRRGKPLPKKQPPFAAPLPEDHSALPPLPSGSPDAKDIRFVTALPFAKFFQDPDCKVFKLTWEELNGIEKESRIQTEHLRAMKSARDLTEQDAMQAFFGHTDTSTLKQKMNPKYHDFIDELNSLTRLRKIIQADVNKFITVKPDLTSAEIKAKLPAYFHDLTKAFLPQDARTFPPKRTWDHKIELLPEKEPPYHKTRPISLIELICIRKWLDENLEKGFIRQSKARCAAPLLLAKKPGGGIRICHDYRGLNSVTIKNRYPLPLIREILNQISRAKYYTKLDIIAAFNKIRITEGHEWKIAFITRFGLFETVVMPFGLCNALANFQNYINQLL
jgi:hypothetical protein